MARAFSVYRRRRNYVDLLLPYDPTIATWTFKSAYNYDTTYTDFLTVGANGFRSPNLINSDYVDSKFRDKVRVVFDPSYFTPTRSEIVDDDTWWIKVYTTSKSGVVSPDSGAQVILPYYPIPFRTFILEGSAPNVIEDNALEIQLPMLCKNFNVQNMGPSNLLIKFEPMGDEFSVVPVNSAGINYTTVTQTISQIYMRGDGGTTDIRASFEIHNQPE